MTLMMKYVINDYKIISMKWKRIEKSGDGKSKLSILNKNEQETTV